VILYPGSVPTSLRIRFPMALLAAAVVAAAIVLVAEQSPGSGTSGKPWIGVHGNKLVDRNGDPVRLLGVNRPGFEYSCVDGTGLFAGPSDAASIAAMKRWRINVVRLPLNESCWLGNEEIDSSLQGAAYRAAVRSYVESLERAGLYVILELQWSAPGDNPATGILPMPSENAPRFWRELASEYLYDRSVIFDLYNEPHDIDWGCWASGCHVTDQYYGTYRTVGMRELVEVVRSTGARQPIMVGGVNWAQDLTGWLAYRPPDPLHALVASNHTYEQLTPCYGACRAALARIAKRFPVVSGEIGEDDCNHNYIDRYMRWADRHGISYLGWAWYIKTECKPSLIENFAGKPTPFGLGLREHLRRLDLAARRSR
jgi:endoglucanase